MTAEQRSPHPDLPTFPWPEFKWPQAEVTPDDLAKIDKLRAQNYSLGASVALFILDEAERLQDEDLCTVVALWLKARNFPPKMHPALKFMIEDTFVRRALVFRFYTAPAMAILNAEEVIRSNEPLPRDDEFDKALFDVYEKTAEEAEQIVEMLGINVNLPEEQGDKDTTNIDSARINGEFIARIAGKMLRETGSPIKVVDWYTDIAKRDSLVEENQDAPYLLEAIEQGRQRVHQICDAAQRLPESIT